MAFLFTLRFLKPGKHCRLCVFGVGFLFVLLKAKRVLIRVPPSIPTIRSSPYRVPLIDVVSSPFIRFRTLGLAWPDPTLGEETGSMIDRVDEGDRMPEIFTRSAGSYGDVE